MKRLLILLILLLATTSYAEDTQVARLSPAIVGGGVPAAAGYVTQDDHQVTIDGEQSFAWADTAPDGGISWTSSSAYTLTKVTVKLKRTEVGLPDGTITGYIHSGSTQPGSSPLTNGTSSNTVDTDDLTESYVSYDFLFPSGVSISSSTRYWVVLTSSVMDWNYDNYFIIGIDASDTESAGWGDASSPTWTNDDTSCQGWLVTYSGG